MHAPPGARDAGSHLKDNLLRMQLQREIEEAKSLEARGRMKEASEHYMRAAGIYRRVAYDSPIDTAEDVFRMAAQYENFSRMLINRAALRSMKGKTAGEDATEGIEGLIVSQKPRTTWDDIGGLEEVKTEIKEAIILPFVGSKPEYVKCPRTILLYGPPGTGKTLLAKASSNTLAATFFEARISSLLSKYFGESTKLVNALFGKARKMQPSLIFMDELDSVAISRDTSIDEATRRVLGQLLTEIEGFATSTEDKILIMGATNKPWDLDDAIISRFQKKIYVPLPDLVARKIILQIHLHGADLSRIGIDGLAHRTDGFSGRDLANLCQEAVSRMILELNPSMQRLTVKELESYRLAHRPLQADDFEAALAKIKPSTQAEDIEKYMEWREGFGG
jgi:katanin p60 ATPase-containing subunit A1